MTRLEDLLYSLAAVIIRYHDRQSGKPLIVESEPSELRKKTLALATDIIRSPKNDFKIKLDELIKASTDDSSSTRKHFLKFILHEIIFLKAQVDRKASYERDQLIDLKRQVSQFLGELKKLISIPKTNTCSVHYSELGSKEAPAVALSGLINNGFTGQELCHSGIFLNEEVLMPFGIRANSSQKDIQKVADQLCNELQNELIIPEMASKINTLSTENQEYQQSLQTLKTQHQEVENKLKNILAKQKMLMAMIMIQHVKSQKREKELTSTNQEQAKVISQLRTQVDDLTQESSLEDYSDSDSHEPSGPYGFFRSLI